MKRRCFYLPFVIVIEIFIHKSMRFFSKCAHSTLIYFWTRFQRDVRNHSCVKNCEHGVERPQRRRLSSKFPHNVGDTLEIWIYLWCFWLLAIKNETRVSGKKDYVSVAGEALGAFGPRASPATKTASFCP